MGVSGNQHEIAAEKSSTSALDDSVKYLSACEKLDPLFCFQLAVN